LDKLLEELRISPREPKLLVNELLNLFVLFILSNLSNLNFLEGNNFFFGDLISFKSISFIISFVKSSAKELISFIDFINSFKLYSGFFGFLLLSFSSKIFSESLILSLLISLISLESFFILASCLKFRDLSCLFSLEIKKFSFSSFFSSFLFIFELSFSSSSKERSSKVPYSSSLFFESLFSFFSSVFISFSSFFSFWF
jgi:hypothetical protein